MVEGGTAQKGGAVSSAALNETSAISAMHEATQDAQKAGILPESVSMGVDIVEVARIRAIMKRSPAFIERSFSCEERAYCDVTTSPSFITLRALPQKRPWLRPWARVLAMVSGLMISRCT